MSVKKAIALIALLAILVFAGLVIVNQFYPNPYTSGIYAFITVTIPAYLSNKLEWVFGSVSAVMAVVGAASKKIGSVKDKASQQVAAAETEANKAKTIATDQIGAVQQLQDEKTALQEEVNLLKTNRTEAEQLNQQYEQEILTLRREKQEFKELAEKKIGAERVVTR